MWWYKLMHRLWGWEYYTCHWGMTEIIRRAHTAPNGRKYIVVYGGVVFINDAYRNCQRIV